MKFDKRDIIEFKLKGRNYLTWRKKIRPREIKEIFYNDENSLKNPLPDKNIEYCHCDMYVIVIGDYKLGIKYTTEEGTYYMFLSANTFWAYPQDIAIGKVVDGVIYLIKDKGHCLSFREIPEEYINKDNKGWRPKSYNRAVLINKDTDEELFSEEDVKCLKIAYEGIRAFSKLIEDRINA